MKREDFFQAKAGNNVELGDAGRQLFPEPLQHGAFAGAVKLVDRGGETGADAGDIGQPPACHQRVEIGVEAFQRLGGAFVGARLERIVAFDLEESADLPKLSGDKKPVLHE